MTEHFKTFLIGLFVIIACLSVVLALLFLRPSVGDEGQIVVVRFTNITGINLGTRVTFAGRPVGEVVAIKEVSNARSGKVDKGGQAFSYELVLAVDSHIQIYDSDSVSIHTTGLLGERAIAIEPYVIDDTHPGKPIVKGAILYGRSGDPVDEFLDQMISVGDKISHLVDRVNDLVDTNAPEIEKTIQSIHQAAVHFDDLMLEATKLQLISALQGAATGISNFTNNASAILKDLADTEFGKNLGDLTQSLSSILEAVDQPDKWRETVDNIASISNSVKDALPDFRISLQNIHKFTGALANGEGTLGKLIVNDDLYLQLNVILSRVDLLMNDVNNYGVLFHLNKNWQRQRNQRSTEMEEICSPKDCQIYFQNELDQVILSLARVGSLINRCEINFENKTAESFKDSLETLQEKIKALEEQLTNRLTPQDAPAENLTP
jgi:phospholipid/cholesterol/gamma-HCH transport system substrate-binding protein